MARTPEGHALTEAHRKLQTAIAAATVRDLLHVWGAVDPANVKGTLDPFTRAGMALVKQGRRRSGAAASRYYVAFRQVEGVRGTVVVAPPLDIPDAVVTGAIRGGALAGIVNGVRRGLSQEKAMANGFVKLAGSATSLVAGGGRETVMDAIQADPAAEGWQRVTSGACCAFCAMIASQGIVAKDADNAGFEAHDHCGCTAEPAYEGSRLNPANERFRSAWDEATSGYSGADALNAFRRSMTGPE